MLNAICISKLLIVIIFQMFLLYLLKANSSVISFLYRNSFCSLNFLLLIIHFFLFIRKQCLTWLFIAFGSGKCKRRNATENVLDVG